MERMRCLRWNTCLRLRVLGMSAAFAACSGEPVGGSEAQGGAGGAGCPAGAQGCECYGNGTCDTGLTCASSVCVNLGSGGSSGQGGSTFGGTASGAPAMGGMTAIGGSTVGGSGYTGGTLASGGGSGVGDTLPAPDAVGDFTVNLVPASATGTLAYTDVVGVVRDAARPQPAIWTIVAAQEGCKLVVPAIPFCDPACASDETCAQGGTCRVTDPTHHSVGTVTIEGVATASGATLTMEPTGASTYLALAVTLLYPPFAEGAPVHLAATGGDYSAFTIDAQGIPPLVMGTSTTDLALNQPINLTWTPPSQTGNSRILVNVDLSQHSTTKGQIVCDVEDTGSLTIGAALVTQLIRLGVAGFPTIGITRQAKGSATTTPGRVDLLLVSSVELEVTVAGFTSCQDATNCPSGQICLPNHLCGAP